MSDLSPTAFSSRRHPQPCGAPERPGMSWLDLGCEDHHRRRAGGWTPARIRTFLTILADCGVVGDAARAAGMSRRSAYRLRNSAEGRAFHLAWSAAQQLARRRLADDVQSRAVHGCVDLIVSDGKVVGERHRFDNRLAMAVLARLDRLALDKDNESDAVRYVAEEFDEFVAIAAAGGEGAADFLADRIAAGRPWRHWQPRLLRRLADFLRTGLGLAPGRPGDPPERHERPGDVPALVLELARLEQQAGAAGERTRALPDEA